MKTYVELTKKERVRYEIIRQQLITMHPYGEYEEFGKMWLTTNPLTLDRCCYRVVSLLSEFDLNYPEYKYVFTQDMHDAIYSASILYYDFDDLPPYYNYHAIAETIASDINDAEGNNK